MHMQCFQCLSPYRLQAQILDVDVDSSGKRAAFKVKMQGTANLWGEEHCQLNLDSSISCCCTTTLGEYTLLQ